MENRGRENSDRLLFWWKTSTALSAAAIYPKRQITINPVFYWGRWPGNHCCAEMDSSPSNTTYPRSASGEKERRKFFHVPPFSWTCVGILRCAWKNKRKPCFSSSGARRWWIYPPWKVAHNNEIFRHFQRTTGEWSDHGGYCAWPAAAAVSCIIRRARNISRRTALSPASHVI